MKKGERAVITISADYGFGDSETKRDLAVVPPNSTLIYDVEVVSFIKVMWPIFFTFSGSDPESCLSRFFIFATPSYVLHIVKSFSAKDILEYPCRA